MLTEVLSLSKEKDDKKIKVKYNEEKAVKKSEIIPEKEKEMAAENAALVELDKERKKIEDEAMAVMERKEALEKLLIQQMAEESKVENELMELTDKLRKTSLKEVEFQNRMGDLEEALGKCRNSVGQRETDLLKLQEEWQALPAMDRIRHPGTHLGEDGSDGQINGESDSDSVGSPRITHASMDVDEGVNNGTDNTSQTALKREDDELFSTKATGPPEFRLPEAVVASLDHNAIEARLRTLLGTSQNERPNLAAIEKYRASLTKFREKENEWNEARQQRESCRKALNGLRDQRESMFMKAFVLIANKLRELYQMITTGGDAELELADGNSPFTDGIYFSVRPPRKSWKHIQNLSGGEKTLSSLALAFALNHFKPTPIYFFDEIDAALDYRNVAIIGHYIEERVEAQFIVVSLRHQMFERADRLVGIYKTYNVTKSVTIDPGLIADETDHENASCQPQIDVKRVVLNVEQLT